MAIVTEPKAPPTLRIYEGEGAERIRLVTLRRDQILMANFQRERLPRQIAKFTGEFDRTAYAFPLVAAFEGHYIDLDGQQRLGACEGIGLELVAVLLVEGIATKERLAELFLRINRDRKLLSAFEKFIGSLGAADPGSMLINKSLQEYDLHMGKSASASGAVPAGAIVAIYDKGGSDLLERVLYIRQLAWGNSPSREAYEGKTLLGLATFIGRYFDRIDDDRLVMKLSKLHPGYILKAVDNAMGQSKSVTYSDWLREQYNSGLRGGRRL
jgi:hypothetical protein